MTSPGDKIALVTGADGGLGTALCDALERSGWMVVPTSNTNRFEFRAKLEDHAECTALIDRVIDRFGRLDLLVNNAANMFMAEVDAVSEADLWYLLSVNLSAPFFLCQRAAPTLRRTKGAIVNIASRWGVVGATGATAYSASKAGLIGLTKALAMELAPDVRVNAVSPGAIDTPQLAVDAGHDGLPLEEALRAYAEANPMLRIASPDEIAETVVFLASEKARYYTGQTLHPNGGRVRL
jgi:NAD(P)-dependent dehydrogenase (short-subunit alcohol dehydrogenase family)